MKRILPIIVKSLFAILISGSLLPTAHAQFEPEITVDIPFAFSADGQEIAAGTYQLQLASSDFLMSVTNAATGKELFITVRPEEDRQVASHGRLTFHICQGHSYLAEIHIPGTMLFSDTTDGGRQKHANGRTCSKEDMTTLAVR